MSNLFKSGFVSFSEQSTLVIDANKNRVIRQIEENNRQSVEAAAEQEAATTEDGFQSFEIENIDMSEVREQANAVFEDAQAAAERILEEARAEALMLKEEAKQEGHEEGYRKGVEDSKEQLAARELELQNHYDLIRQQLEQDYELKLREAEPRMVDVICRLIHKITGVLVTEEQGVMIHMIDNALKDIENVETITIKVSEDDYAEVYSRFDYLKQQINSNVQVELVSDVKLSKLECLIETENGIINCSLNEQLDHLVNSLRLLSQM